MPDHSKPAVRSQICSHEKFRAPELSPLPAEIMERPWPLRRMKLLAKPAKIFVPSVASAEKWIASADSAPNLRLPVNAAPMHRAASEKWVAESGAMPVHAFEQIETMLGQGSVGLELEEQAPKLDTLLVAVGGGGLIGGVAAWYAGRVNVVAVEPESAPTLWNAMRAGHPVDSDAGGIAADSLAPKRVGELMFPIAQKYISTVVLVSDEAIHRAQESLWENISRSNRTWRRCRKRGIIERSLQTQARRTRRDSGVRRK